MNEFETKPTIVNDENGIEIIEDDSFSYAGYQVVRGEFFAHIFEPSFTFNSNKVAVNTACVKKLPEVEYVQILVNPETKMLVVRPCSEEEKDSFRWCSNGKRAPKQINCRIFFAKVISLMGWNSDYRYKLLGKLVRSNGELLFVFDLSTPEIYTRTAKDGEKPKTSRTPSYPAEWQNQFGVPVEDHQSGLLVNYINGLAIFGLQKEEKRTASSPEESEPVKQPETPVTTQKTESEEPTYEQTTLFSTDSMHRPEEEPHTDTQNNPTHAW